MFQQGLSRFPSATNADRSVGSHTGGARLSPCYACPVLHAVAAEARVGCMRRLDVVVEEVLLLGRGRREKEEEEGEEGPSGKCARASRPQHRQ